MPQVLLHICYATADQAWVHGRMLPALGLQDGQYRTRADDALGEPQLQAIERAVDESRFTVLIASNAARWDKLSQFAAALAQHAGWEQDAPRLIVVARDFALEAQANMGLSLAQRALVGLDCSDEPRTVEALARLRNMLSLDEPIDERPECPYPGLACFSVTNRDLLFGRDRDKDAILQRIRSGHSRILVIGPSGSGKSSLIHAAVLPELVSGIHRVQVVPRGGDLVAALRGTIAAFSIPHLEMALDDYVQAIQNATHEEIEQARARLRAIRASDAQRLVVVVDPLEEAFTEDDVAGRDVFFALLDGLWNLPECTIIMCMRADFNGALMLERCWRELEHSLYFVAPLDDNGLRAAIVEPARHAGVHVDAALVERLIRESDRERSSVPLPLLQVALKELWAHLHWRYLTLADYERIVNHDQRGLAAVLAVHADAVLQALPAPGDRAVAQRILLDMVHLGEGRPDTRRRRKVEALRRAGDSPEQLKRVLEKLVEGRLVTTSDGDRHGRGDEGRSDGADDVHSGLGDEIVAGVRERYVDLAHDALITGWPALAHWIAERRDDLRTQRRLEARAAAGGLLDATELPEVIRWVEWTDTPSGQALGASEALRSLVRRSMLARRRRRTAFGVAVLGVTATAIAFALLLLQLRDEKTKTARSVEQAAQAANLIVFELNNNLRDIVGTSQLRTRLLTRSRELLSEIDRLSELNERDQRTRMAGRLAQADLAVEHGHLDEARSLYVEVLANAQRRVASSSTTSAWQRDVAVLYERLGDVAKSVGNLDAARGWFDNALALRTALFVIDHANPLAQRELSVCYERLGEMAMSLGKPDDARAWFDRALQIRKVLVVTEPTNEMWQGELSVDYIELGDVAVLARKIDDARAWFAHALAIREALATANPANGRWRRDVSISYIKLGDLAVSQRELDDASALFNKALAVRESLAAADRNNMDWQRDLSISYIKLGDLAVSQRKLDDAHGWFDKALAVAEQLATVDPNNNDWQHDLGALRARMGDIAMSMQKLDEAEMWFEKALPIAEALVAAAPVNAAWQHDLLGSYTRLGTAAMLAYRDDAARGWFEKSRAVAERLAAADPTNANWQRERCVALANIVQVAGDAEDAKRQLERARTIYRELQQAGAFQRDTQFQQLGADLDRLAGSIGATPHR